MRDQMKYVDEINNSPKKVYATIMGGGSEWVGDFLRDGGGSNTLIGANIPCNREMVSDFLGHSLSPDVKMVSDKVAQQLASTSFKKCLLSCYKEHAIGIGVTCALMDSDLEKEQLDGVNHGHIVVHTEWNIENIYFSFYKMSAYTQKIQESAVKYLIQAALIKVILGDVPRCEDSIPLKSYLKQVIFDTYKLETTTNPAPFSKWKWMMDYCRERRWSPSVFWDLAEKSWREHELSLKSKT